VRAWPPLSKRVSIRWDLYVIDEKPEGERGPASVTGGLRGERKCPTKGTRKRRGRAERHGDLGSLWRLEIRNVRWEEVKTTRDEKV